MGNPNHDAHTGEFSSGGGGAKSKTSSHKVASAEKHAQLHHGDNQKKPAESHRLRNTIIGALAGSAVMPVVGTIAGGVIGYHSGKAK